jgi:5-methylcytosine-specific restriction endonuclease McrA
MAKRDANWIPVKQKLIEDYGHICWLCGEHHTFLTLHHIIKFEITRKTTYNNCMILCEHCHFDIVNKIPYNSKGYWELMNSIRSKLEKYYDMN